MKNKIDLHLHTVFSDGLLTPDEVLLLSKEKNLKAISITDHDTITKLIDPDNQIEIIPGIEISTNIGYYEIHILGYYIDSNSEPLQEHLANRTKWRIVRAKKIIANLNSAGFKLDYDEIDKLAHGDIIARPHIAQAMINKKYVQTANQAFGRYLHNRSKFYVKSPDFSPAQAIKLIREAKGLSFWAHPGKFFNDDIIFKDVVNKGIDGIEIIHTNNSIELQNHLMKYTKDNNLLQSGGSDCHGRLRNGHYSLGTYDIPYAFVNRMKKRLEENRIL